MFQYIETGFGELGQANLPNLVELKYHSFANGEEAQGGVDAIIDLFVGFQKHFYDKVDNYESTK